MALIEINNLHKDYGGLEVLKDISLSIEEKSHIAIVGRNGCGKTTLLQIILGLDDDYKGIIKKQSNCTMSYVPQLPPQFFEKETVMEYMLRDIKKMQDNLDQIAALMSHNDQKIAKKAMEQYSIIREQYDKADGDIAMEQAQRILAKAGLESRQDIEAASLSGGEKNLLVFLKATRKLPDILILDEPGNHLDMAGLAWLEDFLANLPCAILLVSHDRRMIDKIATSIIEIEKGVSTSYKGNYSAYRLEKLKKVSGQGKNYEADQKRLEKLEALVQRFAEIARSRPDPSWGKRLRAKRSQLERRKEEATEKPELGNRKAQIIFDSDSSKADIALKVQNYSKSYDDNHIITDSSFTILTGETVALVGSNGSGKTSFIKDMIETGSWDNLNIKVGPSMKIGYCSQTQDVFNKQNTVEEEFLKLKNTQKEILNHIGKFLFSFEDLNKKISSLSGGELNRLQMARSSALEANFLVLDEPTNHLDIPTREAVEDALSEFSGTVLVVSHDRYFLEKIATRVIFISNNKLNEYEGSFLEYWRDVGKNQITKYTKQSQETQKNKTSQNPNKANIEETIDKMEAEKIKLEKEASKAFDNGDYIKASQIAENLAKHNKRLQKLWDSL